ncbi:MAG: Efflux transporter, family, subunit [Pedosphaera sp.]|nr:Efflux transporter, family, subunit [Pedosphaera sp.]
MNEANPPGPPRNNPPPVERPRKFSFKRPGVIFTTAGLIALLCFYGLRYLAHSRTHVSTDDAFIEADVVAMAPKVSGQVQTVHINDNQFIRTGELLVEIDPRDYQARVNERQAALQAAQAGVLSAQSNLEQARARVVSAEADRSQREAEAIAEAAIATNAERDLQRNQELLRNKTISSQEFDAVRTTAANAKANLEAARHRVASAEAVLNAAKKQMAAAQAAVDTAVAQVSQVAADLENAELNLSYTKIRSPAYGWVTRKAVAPGSYVQVGQNLLAIVPTNLWVVANFKETQLKNMHPGQPAQIDVSAFPHDIYHGHVDSIQAGSGARFSLLPPENAVGNFVKVVQRVPVKILFDDPLNPRHVYGPGMSTVPSVQVGNASLPVWLLLLIAVMVGIFVALFGLRRAAKSKPSPQPA